jgi:hypothetical protein
MSNEFKLATVKVKHDGAPDGFVVINETDFDPAVHVPHDDTPALHDTPAPVNTPG